MGEKKRTKQSKSVAKELPVLDKSIAKALAWEEQRKADLKVGKLSAVRKSYQKQKDFLPNENNGAFWDRLLANDNSQNSASFVYQSPLEKWRIEKILSEINYQQSILNLGVGSGRLEKRLLPKIKPDQYVGTDITQQTLKRLRRIFPHYHFKKTQLTNLPFSNFSFQQILLIEVLEHFRPNQTLAVLAEIYRVLNNQGCLFISVPVNEGLEKMLPRNPNAHQRLYSLPLLCFELAEAGFYVNKVYTASAFAQHFFIKHHLNRVFKFRSANNHLLIASKILK